MRAGCGAGRELIGEPPALVPNLQYVPAVIHQQFDVSDPTAGMTVNVGESLLQDPKQRKLCIPRKPPELFRNLEIHPDAASSRKTIKVPGNRRTQAQLLQHRWIQQVRHRSNFFNAVVGQVYTSSYSVGIRPSGRERLKVHFDGGKNLPQAVMQVPSDTPSFLVLGTQQVK